MRPPQVMLTPAQTEAFDHDVFVKDQVAHYLALAPALEPHAVVVDVGGGGGRFSEALRQDANIRCRVIDTNIAAVASAQSRGVEARLGDAISPIIEGDEVAICFNLVLHHLVGASETDTRSLQKLALKVWGRHVKFIFVNEYIYESFILDLSGRLIYLITGNKLLSHIGRLVAHVVPSLRANTFGTGVRFRSGREWRRLFAEAGYEVRAVATGKSENVHVARRFLLVREIRRDSFVLVSVG